MSKALLKKSLEMFKDDLQSEVGSSSKKKKSSDPMKKITTNRKGVRKALQRLKQREQKDRLLQLNNKRQRTAADDYADMQDYDMTEENITQIQRLSAVSKTTKFASEKILEYHRGKLAKDRPPEEEKAPEPKSVLFDDDWCRIHVYVNTTFTNRLFHYHACAVQEVWKCTVKPLYVQPYCTSSLGSSWTAQLIA